jgi:Dolichyl-phosphate-mannose-protein mannosyltransferase
MNLQDFIHFVEVGAGKRIVKYLLPCLALLGVVILYNFRAWTNFSTPEAMDSAQLARNIATGKGYTTLFVRPFSMYLLQQKNQGKATAGTSDANSDPAQVKTAHPDLANAPVYPMVLAAIMKVLPFHHDTGLKSGFWTNNGNFWRYQPDFLISAFNELLLMAVTVAVYFIARKLFDSPVAWLSAILVLGCNVLWRFSAAGLSTMLLMLIFLGLAWCVLKIEELAAVPEPDGNWILCWSALAGILVGVGALTRYSFGWAIIPVCVFLILFSGPRKSINALLALIVFAVVLSPWVARNVAASGTPFGTAGFAVMEETQISPGPLDRAIHPDFTEALYPEFYWHKFLMNAGTIINSDLFKLGGSWASVLFFAGLLLSFNRSSARRLRYFLLMCLATFIVAQALGRTWLSDESPEINTENLIVLTVPLVFIYGAAFFFILLDQMDFHIREVRYIVLGVFIVLCWFPLFLAVWFKATPIAYPPYFPPDIQRTAGWMHEDELMMSDVPWAVSWYGKRQCVWLTADDQDSFFAINDYIKPVSALFLTMKTMNAQLVNDCFRSGQNSWGSFVLAALSRNDIPKGFPLRHAPSGSAAVSSGMFLTDGDRWKIATSPSP